VTNPVTDRRHPLTIFTPPTGPMGEFSGGTVRIGVSDF